MARLRNGVVFLVLVSVIGLPVDAQEGFPEESEEPTVLDTIILSARLRDEILFEAPVAATVIGGEDLDWGSSEPGAALARRTPNFNFVDFAIPGNSFGSIRGIGPLGSPLNSLDNTIGFSTNGVPTTSFGFSPTLLDVERVEVLRGPQGTLFGRNALGGSINVVTRAPDGDRDLNVGVELGNKGTRNLDLAAGGWLSKDVLASRLAVRLQNFDGDIPNAIIGGKEGDAEIAAARLAFGINPDRPINATITLGREEEDRNNPLYLHIENPSFAVSGSDIEPVGERTITSASMKLEAELDAFTLTSTTGFQDIDIFTETDDTDSFLFSAFNADFGLVLPPSFFTNPNQDFGRVNESEQIFSQEVRLNSPDDSAIEWVAGFSYFRSEYDQDRLQQSNFFRSLNGSYDTRIESQTWAGFGDVSVPINDRLTVSTGLRVARDEQTIDSNYVSNGFPGTVPTYTQQGSFEDEYATGRFAVDYQWQDDFFSFASIARGYSSGGFERYTSNSAAGLDTPPFRPSTVWTYEIGSRARLFDDRFWLSGSVFFNDVTGGQLVAFNATTFDLFFDNQDYRSHGAELEVEAELATNLTLRGALGYTETEIVNVSPGSVTGAVDGNQVPNMPRVTASLGLDFRQKLDLFGTSGDFVFSADVSHVGARQADIANSFEIDGYTLADLRVGWEKENLELYGYARNVFDERPIYFASVFSPNANAAIVGRGRQLGIGARWQW
ncbi:MAG: TonB-dependent receptor [Pseudomonadota bacterium]